MPPFNHFPLSPALLDIAVCDLALFGSPMDGHSWDCAPLSPEEIFGRVQNRETETRSWQEIDRDHDDQDYTEFHEARVAHFILNPDPAPIILAIETYENAPYVEIWDGKHRFTAAQLTHQDRIMASVREGDLEEVLRLCPDSRIRTDLDERVSL